MIKYENNGRIMIHFVELRSEIYKQTTKMYVTYLELKNSSMSRQAIRLNTKLIIILLIHFHILIVRVI